MSKSKYVIIFAFAFIFIVLILSLTAEEKFTRDKHIENTNKLISSNYEDNSIKLSETSEEKTISKNINKLEITEIEGTEVIGKLEIPKINLTTYILLDTSKETLNKSVTRLCGPSVNGLGNLCITGHNYRNSKMFGNLKKVEINDKIYVTGKNGQRVEYVVYDIYTVYPKEVECLSQDTNYERQLTLITCTTGAIKRLVVKATEVYD